jgi:hypothetical protein
MEDSIPQVPKSHLKLGYILTAMFKFSEKKGIKEKHQDNVSK